ncbi:MAG: chlorohydrolase [Thermoplasmata archaeon]|nr:MAG: chlorohydrolase [Thermoplasmata archaeon]
MEYIEGDILTREGFKKGYLGFNLKESNSRFIRSIDEGFGRPPRKASYKGIIIPSMINMHTHIGDTFIRLRKAPLPRNLEELVAPPKGLKYRLLKEASNEEIQRGIEYGLKEMKENGVSHFCDFRENSIQGITLLKQVLSNNRNIKSIILGRPDDLVYDKKEVEEILDNSDGIGVSSLRDWNYDELSKIASHTHRRGKIFAIHASEAEREDIDRILSLKPDIFIHMVYATIEDLMKVKEKGVPIVVCPRSNMFFNLIPNLEYFHHTGITLMVGTDNGMLNSFNLLEELEIIYKTGLWSLEEVFQMVTYIPRKVLNLNDYISGSTLPASLVVMDPEEFDIKFIVERGIICL